ncbi:hypothetical protein LPJ74_004361 [Coemansia sp. RSA 1843]|nr:hypothetical protein LPJ74_004361 [Coemansia sp. RSA 1843]
MATPLFSQPRGTNSSSGGRKLVAGSLAEFKAGRLYRDGETNWVMPDSRRGICYVKKEDDGLLRFVWKEKKTPSEIDELIVFPGDVRLERVKQSSGRVYVLKFQSSSQRLFFWMQGSDETKDDAVVREMNLALNGGEEEEEEEDDDEEEEEEEEEIGEDDEDERALLLKRRSSREAEVLSRHREQSALAQESPALSSSLSSAQVGGVPGNSMRSVSDRTAGADVTPLGSSELEGLRDLLMRTQNARGVQTRSRRVARLQLGDVLTSENLVSVLNDEKLREALFPMLPDTAPRSRESLDQTVRSPQFQQALDALTHVLETGQMAPLVSQLGLEPQASESVEAFLRAIAKKVEQDNDEDAEMHG